MGETINTRNTNIELLRIITMLGVIILHYNNPQIGGAMGAVDKNSLNFYMLYILESISICAVNLFILVSSYFLIQSKKNTINKPVYLIVQVVVFSLGIYLLKILFNQEIFSIKGIIKASIPNNWFVILYITLYLISPYLNLLLNGLSQEQYKKMLLKFIILFSIWPTCVDVLGELSGNEWIGLSSIGMYGSQWGYSIVNFILMYCIGGYIKLYGVRCSVIRCGIVGVLNTGLITIWSLMNEKTGYFMERSAWEYCNPLVILNSVVFFLIFNNLTIKTNKIINLLAKASFTVYLLHSLLLKQMLIENYVNKKPILLLLHLLLGSICIYIVCWLVYMIYDSAYSSITRVIQKWKG